MATTAADRSSHSLQNRSAPVTDSDIVRNAYALYRTHGGARGHDVDAWLQAERALRGAARVTAE